MSRILILSVLPSVALAVPVQLVHQGRIASTTGEAINSEVTFDIGVY